jgi:hypothetical protein
MLSVFQTPSKEIIANNGARQYGDNEGGRKKDQTLKENINFANILTT